MGWSGGAPENTTQTTELPTWAQPYAQSLLQRGAALSDQNMPVYGGQRSADMNDYQTTGMDMVANRALNGSSEIAAGSRSLQDTLNGSYMGPGGSNPYLGANPQSYNGYMGGQNDRQNGYMGNQSQAGNAFMGENPYLQATIDRSARDITNKYNGAVNGTDANFARAGAFGGSAWQANQQGNAHELAQGLADSASGLRFQNYNQSAQLNENALNRDQNYFNTNAGLAENGLNRSKDYFNANAGMAESGLGREQNYFNTNSGMAENGLNRDQQAFQAERANQMNALPLAMQYGNQAYTDAAQMQQVGGQQYGFDQQGYTDQQNAFNDYANAPYKSLDVLGNTIRGAVGGGGTTSSTGPGANPAAQMAGGAAALYGLMK